jgi:hypothetical protein
MAEESRSRDIDYVALDTWHVVLDTNEMFGDFRLRHRQLRFLLENARRPRFRVCVPDVVVHEIVNHFREHWSEALQRYEAAQRDLEALVGRTIADRVLFDEIRVAANLYEADLRREFESRDVHIEPIPADLAGVERLLRRDLDRLKPFGDRRVTDEKRNRRDRGGMRDALIWESVLALCRREPRSLAFVSDNVGDFAEASGNRPLQLHPDLVHDLERLGMTRDMVTFYRTVGEFNQAHLRPGTSRQDASHPIQLRGDVSESQDQASEGPTAPEA